jgi:predicted transcriptional regulator
MSKSLRSSQLDTLELAITNGLTAASVARAFGITEQSGQKRLNRLVASGHLEEQWTAYWLTAKGEEALKEGQP